MAKPPLKNAFPTPPFSRDDVSDFCSAGKTGDVAELKRILDKFGPAILNERESNGDTALTWACWTGKEEAARFLLDKGANIDAPGMQGKTPLIWAAQGGRTEIVKMLLERGANVHAQDDHGQTVFVICDNTAQKQVADVVRDWQEKQRKIAEQKKLEEESRALTADRLSRLKDKAPRIKLGPKSK